MKKIVSLVLVLVVFQVSVVYAQGYPSLRRREVVVAQAKPQETNTPITVTETPSETVPVASPAPQSPGDTAPYYEKQYDSSSDNFKLLKPGVGWALALSPVAGDGLIYTGHPIWGGSLMVTQVLGGVPLLIAGLNTDPDDTWGFRDVAIGFGIVTIVGTFLVDAVVTPLLVHKHNKNLKSPSKRVEPYVGYDGTQVQGGVKMTF